MSWANRNLPRKRDISQIPESLRPQIIPRAERPEIISSESFQFVKDEIVYDNSGDNKIKPVKLDKPENPENSRQYVTKKINNQNPTAFELTYKEKSYVFIILRNIRNVRDNDLWISSYNSIRKFYKNRIIIIDDNSTINTVDGKLINTEVIRSEINGAGEILPYYYFLRYKWADRMIFLHDSMFLNRPFKDNELEGTKFHWHFTSNGFDDYRKITNYISLFKNNKELIAFTADPDTKWNGCFGGASIIDLTTVEYLEEEYGMFTSLTLTIKTRKDRETFERVLGIVLYYEGIFNDKCSNFGDIIKYPGAFDSQNNNMETASYILGQKRYDTAIMKVWRGR